jgi:hypothetical protein
MIRSKLSAIAFLVVIASMSSSPASAAPINFDSFSVGSVNGQGGWTVQDSFGNSANLFDQAVVDLGGGNKVWRASNAITSGSYSNQPFSQLAPLVAGETGSSLWNDFGTNHTMPYSPPHFGANAASKYFYGAFDFKSATGAAQSGLSLTVSPSAKQSPVRMSWLNLADNGTSLQLSFYDVVNDVFMSSSPIISGLAYDEWHKVEMYIEFVDGPENDIVSIFVNNALVHTGTTWESYYYSHGEGVATPRLQAVDSLLFRTVGTAVPANSGGGFYFDNVEVSNAALNGAAEVPEPASLALWGLVSAAGAVYGYRRRRLAKPASEA